MENKLIPAILGIVVSIILIGTILVPVIHDAQTTAGDITIYNNDAQMTTYREAVPGDLLVVYRTSDYDVWALNGERVTGLDLSSTISWNVAIMSDGIYAEYLTHSNASIGLWRPMDESILNDRRYISGSLTESNPLKIEFGESDITLTVSGSIYVMPYTWAYVPCNLGEATYMSSATSTAGGYVYSADDITLCGQYSSGANATTYYYHNGQAWNYKDYSMSVNIPLEIVEGTTDIYTATSVVNIGGEEFNPYRMLVPYEVIGHKDSGPAISLYSAIPLVVLIAVLLSVVPIIRARDN